jgi:hypothetical protein
VISSRSNHPAPDIVSTAKFQVTVYFLQVEQGRMRQFYMRLKLF